MNAKNIIFIHQNRYNTMSMWKLFQRVLHFPFQLQITLLQGYSRTSMTLFSLCISVCVYTSALSYVSLHFFHPVVIVCVFVGNLKRASQVTVHGALERESIKTNTKIKKINVRKQHDDTVTIKPN